MTSSKAQSLAAYKFKIGNGEVVETTVPGTDKDEQGNPKEPDRFQWSACCCVVLAHDEVEALAVAKSFSNPPGYDDMWLAAVKPERIELDTPKGLALFRE